MSDPTRDLVRRAYRADDDPDLTAGLLDVLRRADVAPVAAPRDRPLDGRRRALSVAAVFVTAILVIFGAVTLADRGGDGGAVPGTIGSDPPLTFPMPMPSECAASWTATLREGAFDVTARHGGCPPLAVDRLYLLDADGGNGLITPGMATVFPIQPVGLAGGTVSAPFTFTAEGWPGPAPGHDYTIWYVGEGGRTARPGDDAMVIFDHAYTVSFTVIVG
ncbi:hypothetical protein [Asanoa siamensis]|uniref:Uncharacterized protein n=1 Tax=Asanoa siamensis TaxID=926357 RepID=A0ABQ4CMR7_9ACTN|nr:hypothetical protein [Asanoa siamensis]GIF72586.1 hypothetical protein Asi02nite_21040 [Asanoa siamensis]